MIQRIQSIWLLLAGIAALLTLKLPYYSGIQNTSTTPYNELNAITAGIPVLLVTVAVGLIALINIGLFSNRKLQLRLCIVSIVMEVLVLFLYYRQTSGFTQGTLALSSILHLLVIVFFVLAARGISKDEKLIRESDRLR